MSQLNHRPAGVFHRWDVFVLDERLSDETRRQADGDDGLICPRFAVYFDGPAEHSCSGTSEPRRAHHVTLASRKHPFD